MPKPSGLAPPVRLELSARGGHVGFVAGRWPWRARYWLEERVPAWLHQQLSLDSRMSPALYPHGKER